MLLFKSRDAADDGSPIWELKLAQAQPYEKRERPDHETTRPAREIELLDDGIDTANEGPAPSVKHEPIDRAERTKGGKFQDDIIPF